MKEIEISFPGGKRVDAHYEGRTVCTDQSIENGGEATAAEPFDLFWVSQITCVGLYVLEFCTTRNINTEGLGVHLKTDWNPEERRFAEVEIKITLPEEFPEKYRNAIVRAADLCSVKKHILNPPAFTIALAK